MYPQLLSRSTWLSMILVVVLSSVSAAGEFEDFKNFRIPPHSVWNWYGSTRGTYNHQSLTYYPGFSNAEGIHANIDGGVSWLHDSDPRRYEVTLATYNILDRYTQSSEEDDAVYNSSHEYRWEKSLQERLYLAAGTRFYPYTPPIGVDASGSAGAQYYQSWRKNVYGYGTSDTSSFSQANWGDSWTYDYSANLNLTIGYGRVRDATGIFQAQLFERRLLATGVLRTALSPATLQKIAELHYTRSDLKLLHHRPDRYFWSEIERVLKEDPACDASKLDAYNLYRIAEGIDGYSYGSFRRDRGWFAGPTISARHSHDIYRQSADTRLRTMTGTELLETYTSQSSRSETFHDELWLGASGQYHLPYNMRWQFDARLSGLFALEDTTDGFMVESDFGASYVIADRWVAQGSVETYREISEPSGPNSIADDRWSVNLGGTLRYYLEDRLSLQIQALHDQYRQRLHEYRRSSTIVFGFAYGIAPASSSSSGSRSRPRSC